MTVTAVGEGSCRPEREHYYSSLLSAPFSLCSGWCLRGIVQVPVLHSPVKRENLHRLKNRTALPKVSDFDPGITLDALLQPGDDSNRWSTDHAARIQGEVIDVAYARPEATNCFSPCRRDVHILLANRKGNAKNEQVVLELTPNLSEWATERGIDWSEQITSAVSRPLV